MRRGGGGVVEIDLAHGYSVTMRTERGRLPNFLIIGAAKGGTTSLLEYLAPHPDVYMVPQELHFFDREFARGPDWYREQFSQAQAQKIVGEKTPGYLFHPLAPKRMADLVPDAKLAVILRHPVERAYSHYRMQVAKHTLDDSFEEHIRREMRDPDAPPPHHHKLYLAQGKYVEQLRPLCELYPRESVLVLTMEELKGDPERVYQEMCRFLGIDPGFRPPNLGAVFNATTSPKSMRLLRLMKEKRAWKRAPRLAAKLDRLNRPRGYAGLDPALRAELLEWYRPSNAALAEWLGRDLSAWDR
jgi:sulfotransferase family protein